MAEPLIPRGLTIDQFLAFTDTRPDDERWELVDGVPVLSPSPTDFHQLIVANFLLALGTARRVPWIAIPGIGTKAAPFTYRLPQPDVMVKGQAATGSQVSEEALVLVEVLSRSNTRKDQSWRLQTYQHVLEAEALRRRPSAGGRGRALRPGVRLAALSLPRHGPSGGVAGTRPFHPARGDLRGRPPPAGVKDPPSVRPPPSEPHPVRVRAA